MKIIPVTHPMKNEDTSPCVLVLGYFDALHKGHKYLFDKAKDLAKKDNLKIVVLTFPESPKLTFMKFTPDLLLHLTYPDKRYAKFREYGVDDLYLINFSSHFANLSADEFIEQYIKRLNAQKLVVGFDYKFGKDKKDGAYLEKQFDGDFYAVQEVKSKGQKISSTRIKTLILEGNVLEANQLLGYEYSTRGIVVHGDSRGRTIGYPTANLATIDRTFLPDDGVYVTDVVIKGCRYRAMTSIGKNVTFGGTELRIETNIFDFSEDIYGQNIEIIWLDRIREMIKFSSIEALIQQLESDEKKALSWKKDSQVT